MSDFSVQRFDPVFVPPHLAGLVVSPPTGYRLYSNNGLIKDPRRQLFVARMFDVPPWMVEPRSLPRPRFARVRWALRRWVPRLVWGGTGPTSDPMAERYDA